MRVTIAPSKANGFVTAPPSKSVAHRALICGACSDGTLVTGVAYSEDIDATLQCLEALGARVEKSNNGPRGDVAVGSLALERVPEGVTLDCNESGSTLRFLIPIAMLSGKTVHLTGSERLLQRPLGVYRELSERNGGIFRLEGRTLTVRSGLSAGEIEVPGNISSQFITGLMLALSLASAPSRVRVTDRFESRSYTDITVRVLRDFGVDVRVEDRDFFIPAMADGRRLACENRRYAVEGDCSNAAFLEALAMLSDRGSAQKAGALTQESAANASVSRLSVLGVPQDTAQGDRVYREMLHALADGTCREFDLSDCPDLAPCLFAMAAYYGGAHFTGTARLAIKESDRARACAEELGKFGATLTIGDNDVTVACDELHAPTEPISGHNDHRIVMATALLCTVTGGTIEGAEAVAKSYPDFFSVIEDAGIRLSWAE